ncbi:VanZ family protein [Dyadobacter sp. CY312]|uniref:VanZ family protein n=1 Tax=Dyadobacter sp. CY312 TaxID=2907303 RepID=UPI001F1EDD8A|nr:VanZ family protein [Dyadobacter sp. CY312]MCE7039469.1 VanZ family protein [Dyadobacter sp. CY312]
MIASLLKFLTTRNWAAWLWTFAILIACSLPGKSIPAAPMMGFDKIVHIGLFCVWIILWLLATRGKVLFYILLGMAYGLALEFYQQLLPFDRSFDWWDAVADAVGVLFGYYFKILVIDRYLQRLY